MSNLHEQLTGELKRFGYKFKTVSISHLPEIQNTILDLVDHGLLDRKLFERFFLYLKSHNTFLEAKTIIVIAMPQPVTRMFFNWQGKSLKADVPPTYLTQTDDPQAWEIIKKTLGVKFKVERARIAVKTLAVRSGLAKYGKNNITYVPGLGSFYRLIAFYTDWLCQNDSWQEPEALKSCEKCSLCLQNCPTGSITKDRFLIHAEICLTYHNESEDAFPTWIKSDWHNSLVGCMRCQTICPVNKSVLIRVEMGPEFSEEETGLILNNTSADKLPAGTRAKLDNLIYEDIYPLMARNLKVLIEKQE